MDRQRGDFLLGYKTMEKKKQAMLQVSLKVLLRDGNKVLLTRGEGGIDLPGGRIDVGDGVERLQSSMTSSEISEAKKKAKLCFESNYTNC